MRLACNKKTILSKDKSKVVTFRLPLAYVDEIQLDANLEGLSLSDKLRQIVTIFYESKTFEKGFKLPESSQEMMLDKHFDSFLSYYDSLSSLADKIKKYKEITNKLSSEINAEMSYVFDKNIFFEVNRKDLIKALSTAVKIPCPLSFNPVLKNLCLTCTKSGMQIISTDLERMNINEIDIEKKCTNNFGFLLPVYKAEEIINTLKLTQAKIVSIKTRENSVAFECGNFAIHLEYIKNDNYPRFQEVITGNYQYSFTTPKKSFLEGLKIIKLATSKKYNLVKMAIENNKILLAAGTGYIIAKQDNIPLGINENNPKIPSEYCIYFEYAKLKDAFESINSKLITVRFNDNKSQVSLEQTFLEDDTSTMYSQHIIMPTLVENT